MHVLDHKGPHLSVRGPLNIARPVQGWPVIVQAGASEAGRQLAAETAEVIFAAAATLEAARPSTPTSRAAWKRSAATRTSLKILPGAFVVVGDTRRGGQGQARLLDSLVHYDSAIAALSSHARPRRLGLRPRRPAARDPGDQRQQERLANG
jgi:alkanesulfonate monooxygenase SsuD/methylene tetrahydromethanopterin reductase-like flavin-dependent oxidoreductase (luciferase family)